MVQSREQQGQEKDGRIWRFIRCQWLNSQGSTAEEKPAPSSCNHAVGMGLATSETSGWLPLPTNKVSLLIHMPELLHYKENVLRRVDLYM